MSESITGSITADIFCGFLCQKREIVVSGRVRVDGLLGNVEIWIGRDLWRAYAFAWNVMR